MGSHNKQNILLGSTYIKTLISKIKCNHSIRSPCSDSDLSVSYFPPCGSSKKKAVPSCLAAAGRVHPAEGFEQLRNGFLRDMGANVLYGKPPVALPFPDGDFDHRFRRGVFQSDLFPHKQQNPVQMPKELRQHCNHAVPWNRFPRSGQTGRRFPIPPAPLSLRPPVGTFVSFHPESSFSVLYLLLFLSVMGLLPAPGASYDFLFLYRLPRI